MAAGEVELDHPVERQAGEELERVEAVIHRVDVEVGDVEQEAAAGPLDQLAQEVGLVDLGTGQCERVGDVLEDQRPVGQARTSAMFAARTSTASRVNGNGASARSRPPRPA